MTPKEAVTILAYFTGFMCMYIFFDVVLLKQPIQWIEKGLYTTVLTVLYCYPILKRNFELLDDS